MKDRRRRDVVCSRFFWCTLFFVVACALFTGFNFSSSFRFLFSPPAVRLQPEIVPTWRTMEAVSAGESSRKLDVGGKISIRDAVILPDEVLLFLNYPSSAATSARWLSRDDFECVYLEKNSSSSRRNNHHDRRQPPYRVDGEIVRCPLDPRGAIVYSLLLKSYGGGGGGVLSAVPARTWRTLVYEAIIDRDNTTVVFVKGLNLRSDKLYDGSRFECVYGYDSGRPRLNIRSEVITIAQEIVRCKTPLTLLSSSANPFNGSVKVSIRVKGRGTLHSVARPRPVLPEPEIKPNQLCICTMIRNQARFVREWVMYHGEMGVEKWFIYDNNSDDDLESTIGSLSAAGFNITRHIWPWVKSQEAGFAHCAIQARPWCEWVGFIDVDEFLNVPSGQSIPEALKNQTETVAYQVGEVRVPCHSFGPSGLTRVPTQGVIAGYTCRLQWPERHKSIVRPEALNSSLINVVHHFRLREGFDHVDVDRSWMVINHYKYQVWEVFKEKFYRRVATYVADWQDELNVGSKDRAPGLGTKAVEPADWSTRFCEVNDTGLKDFVMARFSDSLSKALPWEEDEAEKSI
ncbi:Glycosyltransferase family 92 protein RCOM_0530710 [Linum grandiflorum]